MDRFYLLAPAILLVAIFIVALVVFSVLTALGRPPVVSHVKHNQLFGPFFARYLLWLISPLERLLFGRVSPNAITATSLVLCGVTGVAAALGHLTGAAWIYMIAGILDVLDGRLARMSGQQTRAGALFDSVSDRWGELFVLAGYAWYLHDSPWMLAVLAAIGGSMMVSYTRARAEGLGINLAGGIMQRAERITLVVAGTTASAWIAAGEGDSAALIESVLGVTMLICGLASSATAIGRWIIAYRVLAEADAAAVARAEAISTTLSVNPAASVAPARVLLPAAVRKVAPLEQH